MPFQACHKVCLQEAILFSCLCGDPTLPIAKGQKICTLNDMCWHHFIQAQTSNSRRLP